MPTPVPCASARKRRKPSVHRVPHFGRDVRHSLEGPPPSEDPKFKPYFDKFADSQPAFFEAYARAHKKLSELGSEFEPKEGFSLPGAGGARKVANCLSFVTKCCSS